MVTKTRKKGSRPATSFNGRGLRTVTPPSTPPAAPGAVSGISRLLHPPYRQEDWVSAYGPEKAAIYVLGERPGEDEWRRGIPFIGPSGRVLSDWFERAGLSLDCARRWNVVNDYKPGNPEPAKWEVERDREKVKEDIDRSGARVIAAVGAHAIRWVLGEGYDLDTVNGVPIWWTEGRICVPVYHPANSFYQIHLAANGQADVRTVARVVRREQWPLTDTFLCPDYQEAKWGELHSHILLDADVRRIAIDTEGSRSGPWCLTYSTAAGDARLVKAGSPELKWFIKELEIFTLCGGKVVLHNAMFDLGVLRAMGIDLPFGSVIDTMVRAYNLCLEPQGLKALAYRHAGMEMSSYEELVHEANQAHAVDYIMQAAFGWNWPDSEPYLVMERNKETKKFEPKVKKPWSIQRYLDRLVADKCKNPEEIDLRKRWEGIDVEVRRPVEDVLGPMPVATLDDVPFEKACAYANRDADATLRIDPVLERMQADMGMLTVDPDQPRVFEIDMGALPMFERMQANGFRADKGHFVQLGQRMGREMERLRGEIHGLTGAEINPNSPDQVAELIFGQLNLPVGKLTKGGKSGKKKPSTNDKVLEAMRFVHPVMPLILDYRECSKIKSSFCDPLSQLLGRDGRIRGTIKITRVPTGRPSMVDPNLLAQPVRSELGRELRKGFIAEEGCVLGDWDLSQIEMCVMGDQSMDPVLVDLLCDPNKDAHSETAALIFGLPLHKGTKKERYAEVDEIRHRYPAKRVGFGVITGITGVGLEAQMALANATKNGLPLGQGGDPWTEDDCDGMIEEWFKVYRGVKQYMLNCRAELRQYGYVTDQWGRVRYLPGVYSEKSWVREEAERQSHSHKISSSAQGIMKLAMREIWGFMLQEWGDEGRTHKVGDTVYPGRHVEPLLSIYDSLVMELDDDPVFKEYWNSVMVGCMTQTVKLKVPIRVKGSWSYRWGGD